MNNPFHAFHKEQTRIIIQAIDTGVVVLEFAFVSAMSGCQIWLAFGQWYSRYFAAQTKTYEMGS